MMDSHGIVRMLNRSNANSWMQVANLKKHCKGKSDNYWLCGIHENPQQIRAILCKGNRYPPTVPRPTVQILSYQLPLCDMATDKGLMEENLWRNSVMSQHLDWWDSQGYDVDDTAKSQALMPQQEALMKLFALACKTGREYRAVELCELMPNHHTVQLAIKYASRTRLIQLAQKLTEVARCKAEEEMLRAQKAAYAAEEASDEEDEIEERPVHVVTQPSHSKPTQDASDEEEEADSAEEMEEESADVSADIYEEIEQDETPKPKPMLKFGPSKNHEETTPKSVSTSQAGRKNPFKLGSEQKTPQSTGMGTSVFDSMEKPKNRYSGKCSNSKSKDNKKSSVLKNKKSSLFGANKNKQTTDGLAKKVTKKPSKSGYELWLEENKDSLQEEHPDQEDITSIADETFKGLSQDEQDEWTQKASVADDESRKRKRKREKSVDDTENTENKEKPTKNKFAKKDTDKAGIGSMKLKGFAFGK